MNTPFDVKMSKGFIMKSDEVQDTSIISICLVDGGLMVTFRTDFCEGLISTGPANIAEMKHLCMLSLSTSFDATFGTGIKAPPQSEMN